MNIKNLKNIAWKNLTIIIIAILVFVGFEENQARKYAPAIEDVVGSIRAEIEGAPAQINVVIDVYDGDTFTLSGGEKVRLIGINAPEIGEEYSIESRDFLSSLVLNKEVRLEVDVSDKDKYNRLLRYVYIDDLFINEVIVGMGLALEKGYYPDTKMQKTLEQAEFLAKEEKVGLWSFE